MDIFGFERPPTFEQASRIVLQRAEPLEVMIAEAYQDQKGATWRAYQLGMFKLHTQYPGPWQEDWASHALRTLAYDMEDKHMPWIEPPPEARTRDAYVDYAVGLLPTITTLHTPLLRFLFEQEPTREQWRIYLASAYGRGRVHHGNLARLALNLPREQEACFAYRMLGDEGGQGKYEKAHSTLLLPTLQWLGGTVADTDKLGELFEGKVLFNWAQRSFMNKNPVAAVASIFYLESQAGLEFERMLPRLRKAKFPEEVLEFFVIHGDDPETELHNDMCKQMLRSHIHGYDDIKIAHNTIMRLGRLFDDLFDSVAKVMGIG